MISTFPLSNFFSSNIPSASSYCLEMLQVFTLYGVNEQGCALYNQLLPQDCTVIIINWFTDTMRWCLNCDNIFAVSNFWYQNTYQFRPDQLWHIVLMCTGTTGDACIEGDGTLVLLLLKVMHCFCDSVFVTFDFIYVIWTSVN